MSSELRWSYENGWFWSAIVLLIVVFSICLWNAHRHAWAWRHVGLETLRFLLALAICLLLAKPESWQSHLPDDPARILVLTDASASMYTPDMDGQTRREWVESHWQPEVSQEITLERMAFESADSGVTNLHAALLRAGERNADLAGIIILSDGDWNAGQPPQEAALQLRAQGVPLIAVPVGSEIPLPDIALSWQPMPKTLVVDEPTRLPFQVENRFARDAEIAVSFSIDDREIEMKTFALAPGEVFNDAFLWKPTEEDDLTLSLTTPILHSETREDNNASQEKVRVQRERLQVLLVDSVPRWEFRYLRNALMRDQGVDVACVLFHPEAEVGLGQGPGYLDAFPKTTEALTDYDVVFLGDVGIGQNQLTETHAKWLRGLVERQASGLVFLPGRRNHQKRLLDSPLGELLPVALEGDAISIAEPASLELTAAGRDNVLTLLGDKPAENAAIWRSLPGFTWHAPVSRTKAGATVLAVHESSRNTYGRLPLLVTRPFGSGKVLYLATDGAWRWRRGVEDLYHYRFWSQVARWMAYQRNLAESNRGRIIHYPEAPTAGQDVTFHATLLSKERGPMTEAKPTLTWQHTKSNEQGTLPLTEIEGGWGVYRGSWTPPTGGPYHIKIQLPGEDPQVATTIQIATPPKEATGAPARPDVLRRLAEATKGQLIMPKEIGSLASSLQTLTKQEPIIQRKEWWHHPITLAGLLIGLTVFWIARKRLGLL